MKQHRTLYALNTVLALMVSGNLIVFGMLITQGCIHKTGSAVTPWEKVTTYNAVLAETNNTIEQGAELAAAQKILPVNVAREVIEYTSRVASVHLQITAFLAKGSAITASDTATLNGLLAQIQASGTALVTSGVVGVKNPKSQQTIAADITSLVSLAQTITELVPALLTNPAAPAVPATPAGLAATT
jgi:hypothetical protein